MLRRLKQVLPWLLVAFAALLVTDYMLVRVKEKRAASAVSQADGRMGSIPGWPIGSEYRVTFDRPLQPHELERLAALNALRGSVAVGFIDCQFTEDQSRKIIDTLHYCLVFQVIDGQTRPLGR